MRARGRPVARVAEGAACRADLLEAVDAPRAGVYGRAIMEHSREREEERATSVRPPEPAPPEAVRAGSLDWASAIGNQAVARLARQTLGHEESESESEAEEAPPPEVEQLEAQWIGMDSMAALAGIDDMAEGDLPE